MNWLNYHHLLYFWMTAREGGVGAAARKLRLTQPTVSGQLRELERNLGVSLFERDGGRLRLTPVGERVFEYADEIFALGDEILRIASGRSQAQSVHLVVGCADVLPKMVAFRLLEPAFRLEEPVHVVARQGRVEALLADLCVHALDLVLADAPIPAATRVRAFNHLLGESEVGFFASPSLAEILRPGFPRSLTGQPVLLPASHTMLRRSLDGWFAANAIAPRLVGEFDDSALLKVFARAGVGAFAAPSVVRDELLATYGVDYVGACAGVRERFYAITLERRIRNPAVAAISEAARTLLVA